MVKKTTAKNPVPFRLSGSAEEEEEKMIGKADSSLNDEERVFVWHYLRLAAMLLGKEPAGRAAAPEYKPQERKLRLEDRKAA